MKEKNEVVLDSDLIVELINKFPNDMDLGKYVRSYYTRLTERNSHNLNNSEKNSN